MVLFVFSLSAVRLGRALSLAVFIALGAASLNAPAQADALLPPDLRRLMEVVLEDGTPDRVAQTAKLAAQVAPGSEPEILALVAAQAPDMAPEVAEALGLRKRTALAAVEAAREGGEALAGPAALEAQTPRFFSFEGWDGTIALGVSATTGNSRQQEGALDLSLRRAHRRVSYELTALADLASADGAATRERYAAGFQLSYDISDRWFAFAGFDGEKDRFTGFDYRTSLTPGIGYRIINRDKALWRVQGGPTARLEQPEDSTARTSVGAAAESLFRWESENGVTVENESDVIATRTTTLSNRIRFGFPIYKALSLALSNEVRYEFQPPAGAENLDTTSRASIAYSF